MRATVDQVKAAILHPVQDVREAAVSYLRRSPLADETIMPLVIQAYQQYGPSAFAIPIIWHDLPQSPETVEWLIEQLQQQGPPASVEEDHLIMALIEALYRTAPPLLEPWIPAINALQCLDEHAPEVLADRVLMSTFSFEQLWREFLDFSDADEEEYAFPDETDFLFAVVDNLCRFPEEAAPRVLELLRTIDATQDYWLEEWIIQIAGKLRLEAAVPLLVDRLFDPDTLSAEAANPALKSIGTDSIVAEIATVYAAGDWDCRLTMACILEDIHTDLSVRTSLELLSEEDDVQIKGLLITAALLNFATEAIQPARQFVLDQPKNPETLEVRHALLTASRLLGESFPEMEEWSEDSQHDSEFRRQWYQDHPPPALFEDSEFDDSEFEEADGFEDEELEDDFDDEPDGLTIRYGQERIGRNDPCPCGSGRKYKKCCARRGVGADGDEYVGGMGGTRPPEPVTYPIGTVAHYGPDDKTTTKIAAGVIKHFDAEPIIERWVGTKITQNPKVQRQMTEFFERHGVKSVVISDGNMGCPHEEGADFPEGEDCPFCPFWAGKQGSNRKD